MADEIVDQREKAGELIQEIGRWLFSRHSLGTIATLLYADITEDSVGGVIFDELDASVIVRNDGHYDLPGQVIRSLWETSDPKDRWCEFEFFLHGTDMKVQFFYPDQEGHPRDPIECQDALLRKYFGEKPYIPVTLVGTKDAPVYKIQPDGSWVPIHDPSVEP